MNFCNTENKDIPKTQKGILDLQNWNLERGVVKLDGEWEFFPGTFLNLESYHELKKSPEHEKSMLFLDSTRFWGMQNLSPIGYGTYVLQIKGLKEDIYSIYLESIRSAHTIEINGIPYGGLGKISKDKEGQVSELKRKIVTFYQKEGSTYILLCVSNYEYMGGGILGTTYLGRMEDIDAKREKNLVGDVFLSGIFFLFGLYHISLYLYRRKDSFTLYFGLFCILMGARILLHNDRYIYDLIPQLPLSWGFRIDYLTMYLGAPLFFKYLSTLYPEYINGKIFRFTSISYIILSIGIFLVSQIHYNKALIIVQILILINISTTVWIFFKMVKQKVQGSKTFLFAVGLFLITVVSDLVIARFSINTFFLVPYGLFIFIFFQAVIIIKRFSSAFEKVEQLSDSLLLSNKELESMTKRATDAYLDLENTQKQLLRSDRMVTLGTMVAGVAHEINTPLSAIRANSENIPEHLQSLLTKLNPEILHLTSVEYTEIVEIIDYIKSNQKIFSTKEIRQIRKKINETLVENRYKNIEYLSDALPDMGLTDEFITTFQKVDKEKFVKYIQLISEFMSIGKKSSVILISSERVSKIVKSLKSFMHFEEKEEKVLSDLTEGMETVLTIMHNKIKYGIEVTKNYGDIPKIPCYPDELNQIWTNLIHNAVQAMGDTGKLQVDMEQISSLQGTPDIDKRNPNYTGDYISVSIQDSGSGIPPEIRQKIFQAFFTTKPAGEGSGLGLHIIGKILEKHEGALFLESEPGKTRFSVILPI